MRNVLIQNLSSPLPEGILAEYCTGFWEKFKGLMLRSPIACNSGIVLVEPSESRLSTSIHMFFMRFDITAVWLNSQMEVVDVQLARAWRPSYTPAFPARFVLELHADHLTNFKIGDKIGFEIG